MKKTICAVASLMLLLACQLTYAQTRSTGATRSTNTTRTEVEKSTSSSSSASTDDKKSATKSTSSATRSSSASSSQSAVKSATRTSGETRVQEAKQNVVNAKTDYKDTKQQVKVDARQSGSKTTVTGSAASVGTSTTISTGSDNTNKRTTSGSSTGSSAAGTKVNTGNRQTGTVTPVSGATGTVNAGTTGTVNNGKTGTVTSGRTGNTNSGSTSSSQEGKVGSVNYSNTQNPNRTTNIKKEDTESTAKANTNVNTSANASSAADRTAARENSNITGGNGNDNRGNQPGNHNNGGNDNRGNQSGNHNNGGNHNVGGYNQPGYQNPQQYHDPARDYRDGYMDGYRDAQKDARLNWYAPNTDHYRGYYRDCYVGPKAEPQALYHGKYYYHPQPAPAMAYDRQQTHLRTYSRSIVLWTDFSSRYEARQYIQSLLEYRYYGVTGLNRRNTRISTEWDDIPVPESVITTNQFYMTFSIKRVWGGKIRVKITSYWRESTLAEKIVALVFQPSEEYTTYYAWNVLEDIAENIPHYRESYW